MPSHPGSAGEVVAKVIGGLLQLALNMNAGLVSCSRVELFIKKGFNFDSRTRCRHGDITRGS